MKLNVYTPQNYDIIGYQPTYLPTNLLCTEVCALCLHIGSILWYWSIGANTFEILPYNISFCQFITNKCKSIKRDTMSSQLQISLHSWMYCVNDYCVWSDGESVTEGLKKNTSSCEQGRATIEKTYAHIISWCVMPGAAKQKRRCVAYPSSLEALLLLDNAGLSV